MGDTDAADLLQPTELDHLKVIPSSKHLIGANLELVNAEFREYRLRHALQSIRSQFEILILDCPPALDLLTLNALVAADSVLVPMHGRGQRPLAVQPLEDHQPDHRSQAINPAPHGQTVFRSEERRVGKEGRSRFSPYH